MGELTRRRLETADHVAAVNDGAEWIQAFLDEHCPQAVRILDFPHAAERVCQIGDGVLGEGTPATARWRTEQLHQLKHDGARDRIPKLRTFAAAHVTGPGGEENLAYLEKRVAQMQDPSFQAAGWPIGSGVVESGNKVVVDARRKGAGMQWARARGNPLLTLRNPVWNDRWAAAWQQSSERMRRAGKVGRAVTPKRSALVEPTAAGPVQPVPQVKPVEGQPCQPKPAATHPWRRTYRMTQARKQQADTQAKR